MEPPVTLTFTSSMLLRPRSAVTRSQYSPVATVFVWPAAVSAVARAVALPAATARRTSFSLSERRCARMFRSSVRVAALSVRRYVTISASVRSNTLVAALELLLMAVMSDCATASSAFWSAARNPAT